MKLAIAFTFYNWEMGGIKSNNAVGDYLLCTAGRWVLTN